MDERDGQADERLLRVEGGDGTFPDTHVQCPVIDRNVRLQRCAFCDHSFGLLLDGEQNTLTLRCGAPSGAWREP